MTRRFWVLVLGAGLCGSLGSGCRHTVPDSSLVEPCAKPAPASQERAGVPAAPQPPVIDKPPKPGPQSEPRPDNKVANADDPLKVDLLPPLDRRASSVPSATLLTEIKPMDVPQTTSVQKPEAESPILAAFRCYLDRRPADAIALLSGYDKTNQDWLLCLLPLAARMTEGSLDRVNAKEAAVLLDQLNGLAEPLRARAPLFIDRICFCKTIESFGNYEPLPKDHSFRAGELVHVYVELRNFTNVKIERGSNDVLFVPNLDSKIEISNFGGELMFTDAVRRGPPERTSSPRHDYFDGYQFSLPPKLKPGSYTLRIVVTDVPTQRTNSKTLDFHVVNVPR